MEWLKSLPPQALLAVLVLAAIVVAVTMAVAIVQGRELSFWPPRLGPRPAQPGPSAGAVEPAAYSSPVGPTFDGTWESIWGWSYLLTEGSRARGAVINRSGLCFRLEGTVDGDRLVFEAVRYEQREIAEEAGGHYDLSDGGRRIKGTWRDGAGANIAVEMERVRWDAAVKPT